MTDLLALCDHATLGDHRLVYQTTFEISYYQFDSQLTSLVSA
jgi:hypothetical protein